MQRDRLLSLFGKVEDDLHKIRVLHEEPLLGCREGVLMSLVVLGHLAQVYLEKVGGGASAA